MSEILRRRCLPDLSLSLSQPRKKGDQELLQLLTRARPRGPRVGDRQMLESDSSKAPHVANPGSKRPPDRPTSVQRTAGGTLGTENDLLGIGGRPVWPFGAPFSCRCLVGHRSGHRSGYRSADFCVAQAPHHEVGQHQQHDPEPQHVPRTPPGLQSGKELGPNGKS